LAATTVHRLPYKPHNSQDYNHTTPHHSPKEICVLSQAQINKIKTAFSYLTEAIFKASYKFIYKIIDLNNQNSMSA
jgi:hypothetical protein